MFKRNSKAKCIVILLSSIIFILLVCREVKAEKYRCMGIPFITEEELQQIPLQAVELDNIVSLEGELTAFDQVKRKIYLPCTINDNTKFYDLEGQLKSTLPQYDLYFLWEGTFDILKEAVMYGSNFTLYAIDAEGHYATYAVNFTQLPIIELQGEVINVDDRDRDIYSGELTVWEPEGAQSKRLQVQSSNIEWHVRGFSSQSFPKKSLKLNLKEKDGNQNNLSMLGFESDDDYILNPLYFDDVDVREKLAMELWNELTAIKGSTLKMTGGEYCELIINGEYQGLRLLQNKIEKKYLKLKESDILLKGNNVNVGTQKGPNEVYEIVYSSYDEKTTYATISDFFYETDFSNVDLESWVDMQLFLQLGNMKDNEAYKNTYYVIQKSEGQEIMKFIPWDTDMSFGIYWDISFNYLPESVEIVTYRIEYEALKEQYPQLDEMLAKRWKELRESFYTEGNIIGKINKCVEQLYNSGALHRDFSVLGWYPWGGRDTYEALVTYIQRRLEVLDAHYGLQ